MPASSVDAAITGQGASIASSTSGGNRSVIETTPTKSGRSGRIRRAITPPMTRPIPVAASTSPHTEAPPSDSLAITGPRTLRAPASAAFANAKPSTTTQIQVRELNSRQPSTSSWTKLVWPVRSGARIFIGSRIAAATR